MAVKPIPEGFHTMTPCLAVETASALLDFMKRRGTVAANVDQPTG